MLRLPVLFAFLVLLTATARAASIEVSFFSETVRIDYAPELLVIGGRPRGQLPPYLTGRYREFGRADYYTLLNSLQAARNELQLNDWLYFDLLQRAVRAAYPRASELDRRVLGWFLLCQANFDARLTYLDGTVWINAYTDEALFEVGMITEGSKKLVNLSSLLRPEYDGEQLYILNYVPNPTGRSFSFDLDQLPRLTPRLTEKTYQFETARARHRLRVQTDQTVVDVMRRYPFMDEEKYLEAPLSASLATNLVPQLRRKMEGLTERERVQLLAAFTRMSFGYKTDEEHFGRSRPMIADEVLAYPYSDCEDRSALFYALAKELIGAPMLVLAYPDHVTVAVATEVVLGDAIVHRGRNYYICDPTGPSNSDRVGRFPKGYADRDFEILSAYR